MPTDNEEQKVEPKSLSFKASSSNVLRELRPLSDNCTARFIGGVGCYGRFPNQQELKKRREKASAVVKNLCRLVGCTKVYTTFEVSYIGFIESRNQTFDMDVNIIFRWKVQNSNQKELVQYLQARPALLRYENIVVAALMDGKLDVKISGMEYIYQNTSQTYRSIPLVEHECTDLMEVEDIQHHVQKDGIKNIYMEGGLDFKEVFESDNMNAMLHSRETLDD